MSADPVNPPPGNPLLAMGFSVPFDRIDAAHIEPGLKQLLQEAAIAIERVENSSEPLSYATTLGALEIATEKLELAMGVVGHLESVATTAELRAAYNAVQPEVSAFY